MLYATPPDDPDDHPSIATSSDNLIIHVVFIVSIVVFMFSYRFRTSCLIVNALQPSDLACAWEHPVKERDRNGACTAWTNDWGPGWLTMSGQERRAPWAPNTNPDERVRNRIQPRDGAPPIPPSMIQAASLPLTCPEFPTAARSRLRSSLRSCRACGRNSWRRGEICNPRSLCRRCFAVGTYVFG